MTRSVAFGLLLTGVTLIAFMLWTFHEMRRVDKVIEEIAMTPRGGDDEGPE